MMATARKIAPLPVRERGILFSRQSVLAIRAHMKTQTRRLVDLRHLRVTVRRDVWSWDPKPHPHMRQELLLEKGKRRLVDLNPQGAVFAKGQNEGRGKGELRPSPDGIGIDVVDRIGLKPGEFDFSCPFADGQTLLLGHAWAIAVYPGQRLWVRESFAMRTDGKGRATVRYDADGASAEIPLTNEQQAKLTRHNTALERRSGLLMPRWASRTLLEVTAVRLEPLHALSLQKDAGFAEVLAEGFSVGRDSKGPLYGPYGEGLLGDTDRIPWEAYARAWDELHKDVPWQKNPFVWVVSFREVEETS